MIDVHSLRRQAQRCFRLAKTVNDHDAATLEAMGREFEQRAAALERTIADNAAD